MPARGAGANKDKASKGKAAKKSSDDTKVAVNKDYLGQHWDVNIAGNVGIYQSMDADGNATDFSEIVGEIMSVKYDKTATLQKKDDEDDDDGKANSRKKVTPPSISSEIKLLQKINKK
jgi:hypothetical protein